MMRGLYRAIFLLLVLSLTGTACRNEAPEEAKPAAPAPAGSASSPTSLFPEDLIIQQEIKNSGYAAIEGAAQPMAIYLSGNAMRQDVANESSVIVRYDQNKIYQLNHKQKSYWEYTFDEAKQEAERNAQQGAQAQRQLGVSDPKVTKTGRTESFAGYQAEEIKVDMGKLKMDLWVSNQLPINQGALTELSQRLGQWGSGFGQQFTKAFEGIAAQGFPLKQEVTIALNGITSKQTVTTTKIEKAQIPADRFEVPADYQKTAKPKPGMPAFNQ